MKALGRHILLELRECETKILDDIEAVKEALMEAARRSGATIVEACFHRFNPFGISGVVIIAESHLSVHTWPEYGYAACDIFTCGTQLKPETATEYLIERFQSKSPQMVEISRGILSVSISELPHKVEKSGESDGAKEYKMVF